MENENIEVTEQMKKDSDFLRETYSNKKAVDSAVKKASIIDFVSKDENRYFMTGVYYENGFAVATNGRVLIKLKTNYPSEYEGKIIAIIHRTNDNDDKLIIVPDGKNYSDDAIDALIEFQEQYFEHEIIR